MVAGVASLLDEQHDRRIRELWQEFMQRFGVHGVSQTPIPHFTYHVAENYDTTVILPRLQEIASSTSPFVVHTNGLGIFTGPAPMLYVHVRPDPPLLALHRRLWHALEDAAQNPSLLYHPDHWQPHITLTTPVDVGPDLLADVVRLIAQRDFSWEFTPQVLSILSAPADGIYSIEWRIELAENAG